MTLEEKLERSKSSEKIDFSKFSCLNRSEDLVLIENSNRIAVEPIWTLEGDFEGGMYTDYIADHPEYNGVYVRSGVLTHLKKAANSLDDNYKLIIRAGHRPIEVQRRLIHDVMQEFKKDNPGASDDEALAHARIYVSDPDIKLPPHCCGAAVDVDMLDTRTNALVDFGSPVNIDAEISHLHFDEISPQQKQNRLILLTAMLNAGFSSYYAEWWHYTYGDEIWAWFYRKDACLYGLAEI